MLKKRGLKSLFACLLLIGNYQYSLACHNFTVTETSFVDNGNGTYTYVFQCCLGIEDTYGFYLEFAGANVISASPNTLSGTFSTVSLSIPPISGSGQLEYGDWDNTGGTLFSQGGTPGECHNVTVTLDATPTDVTLVAEQDGFGTCSETANTTFIPSTPECGDDFFDTGGPTGTYQNNELITWVICPLVAGDMVTVSFSSFNLESGFDDLTVYDNNSASGGSTTYTGTTSPGTITATNPSGCLTFVFDSDGSITRDGWEATVTCSIPSLSMESQYFEVAHSLLSNSNLVQFDLEVDEKSEIILQKSEAMKGDPIWIDLASFNTEKTLKKRFLDADLNSKESTYRLVIKGESGIIEFSQEITIQNEGYKSNIKMYPNPVENVLLVSHPELSGKEITIYNSLGNVVFTSTLETSNQNAIDVSELPVGFYFVNIQGAGTFFNQKIYINR